MGLIFVKALFEGLIFGRSIGLALWLEGNLPFLLCFTLYLRAISKYKPCPCPLPRGGGGLYLEGRFNGGFFALQVWGALNVDALSFGILWCSRTLGGR